VEMGVVEAEAKRAAVPSPAFHELADPIP